MLLHNLEDSCVLSLKILPDPGFVLSLKNQGYEPVF